MSNRLAARHKCSVTLKSPLKKSSLSEKKTFKDVAERKNDHPIFPWIFCLVFFIHWIIVCPLIWALLYRTEFSENWPDFWHWLFWLVAFIIWLLATLVLILIWRKWKNSENERMISGLTKINSNQGPYYSTNVESVQPDIRKMRSTSWDNDEDTLNSRRNVCKEETRKEGRKKLAPLIIHRNISGTGEIENSGEVKIENFDDAKIKTPREEKSGLEIDWDMEKYLKIVTLNTPETPETSITQEEKNATDVPLSPRELFFIDLIRHAEKSEDNVAEKLASNKGFFENEESSEKNEEVDESSYFIANVESPMSRKNEIFIEIDQPENATTSVCIEEIVEKPKLTLISVAKECQDNEEQLL